MVFSKNINGKVSSFFPLFLSSINPNIGVIALMYYQENTWISGVFSFNIHVHLFELKANN